MAKNREKQEVRNLPRPESMALPLVSAEYLEKTRRSCLQNQFSDCNLFSLKDIAHRAGYSDPAYFRTICDSHWHMHQVGSEFYTHTTSAEAGRADYDKEKKSRSANKRDTSGLLRGLSPWTDVSSGSNG